MTPALLDHPWTLDASPFGVLRTFDALAKTNALKPVPFIPVSDWADWLANSHRYKGPALAGLRKFASQLIREPEADCVATPNRAPADLSRHWRAALRDAAAVGDWRSPQIVITDVRSPDWPRDNEVEIRFDPCENQPDLPPERRVLVTLHSYESHPFAKSDLDPWDLQRIHPPRPDALPHVRHPCCLPKPPMETAGLDDLEAELLKARRGAWGSDGKYYFFPSEDWTCETVSRETWRSGRAFPKRRCRNSNGVGWVDFRDIEWVWDEHERHWDVQTSPNHTRVSHTGDLIGRSAG